MKAGRWRVEASDEEGDSSGNVTGTQLIFVSSYKVLELYYVESLHEQCNLRT